MKSLNTISLGFYNALIAAQTNADQRKNQIVAAEKIHVVGVGKTVTLAYEQLRKAAENAEEHLLLQRAIRRFYKRLFLSQDEKSASTSGEDLIAELTFAGYIANDSIPASYVDDINATAKKFVAIRGRIGQNVSIKQLDTWTLDPLSVAVSHIIDDVSMYDATAQFAFQHFSQVLDGEKIFGGKRPDDFDAALFVAIHTSLLKADQAIIRYQLLQRYQINARADHFSQINRQIDDFLVSATTDKLTHIVDRRAAPLRVMLRMMKNEPNFAALLANRSLFMSHFAAETEATYDSVQRSINRGILRSVIFLIITKFLVGLAVEVPYDLIVHSQIMWLPLAINLLFPPVYMIMLRMTLIMPGAANSSALAKGIDEILYDDKAHNKSIQLSTRKFGAGYNAAYTLFIFAIFGGAAYGLWLLGFEWIHLAIFFVFISAASFLGFRLSRLIREIEVVDSAQSGVTLVRDFLYMPFVVVGRWMSEKYSRVNIVSMLLDMLIELPLKTLLNLIRQWSAFVSAKKDGL